MAAKRTRKLLVWALCLHTSLAFSQTTFQKTFGGPGNEAASWVIETMNGFVIAGHVTNPSGNQDALLMRLNASGNIIWQNRFGAGQADAFHAVVATPDGGFLAVGETRSYGAGSTDIFLVKVDAAGIVAWSKTIGDATHDEIAKTVLSVTGGGYVVSGSSALAAQSATKSVLLRLDANGNTVWSQGYSTATSNLFVSSYIDGDVIYASGSAENDGAFVRFDLATGNILSTKIYAGNAIDALSALQPTQDGNLVVADYTRSTALGTEVELWAQKINRTTGQVLWSKSYYRLYDNIRGSIEKVNDGGFLLVPYDNNNSAQAEALLAKIDASGNLLWSYNYGGAASDRLMKAVQTADGGFVAVGDTRSGSANGNSDILVIKTNGNGRIQGVCAKSAGILSVNFTTNNLSLSPTQNAWVQSAALNASPLSVNLQGQGFMPNTAPVIAQNIPLCPNKPFHLKGADHFAPKIISDTIFGLNGCDTILKYNLTLTAFNTALQVIGLCSGETYAIDGIHYVSPATIIDTIPSLTGGCDTLFSIVLKSKAQSSTTQTINFCPGESVMINGQLYDHADTVHVSIPSTTGECDTLLTYHLVERAQPVQNTTISFCQGESVLIGGYAYDQPGVVSSTIPSMNGGCDTLVNYTLELRTPPVRTESLEFCQGESVTIAGQTYTQSGAVQVNIPSVNGGCDTAVTYLITVHPQITRAKTLGICPGGSVTILGQTYSQPATIIASLPSATGGCDTIVTYTIELQQQITRTETIGFCPGGSVTVLGQVYNQPATVVANLPSGSGGCDTVVTYTIELQQQITRAETLGFCPGESVTIAGHTYTQPGTVVANFASTTGACDSVVTYTLQHLTPAPSNIAIQCPNDITIVAGSGSRTIPAAYPEPVAASDCVCPGLQLNMTNGLPSGSLFPVGSTQVCYTAKDNCGQEKPCCFSVNIREEDPCDVKVSGCLKYELLSVTADQAKNHTYRIRVTNNCANKLIYTAIQIPDGLTPMEPANNSTYTAQEGNSYVVRCPNYLPMYSVRFKSMADSIANGQSDVFEYTLPAQAEVRFIHITTRLAATQAFYEAHLNTFNCPVGVTPVNRVANARDAAEAIVAQNSLLLFPNPTTGVLYADLSDWQGQKLQIQVMNAQGQLIQAMKLLADEDLVRLEMPQGLTNGIYFLEVAAENGQKETMRFMLRR